MNFLTLRDSFIILLGLILPYDYYGAHLDGSENTIDKQLEIRNFKRAGRLLKHGMFVLP